MTPRTGTPATWDIERSITALTEGEIRLLTCDVFDTIVWRPAARPHDVFPEIARRMRDDGCLQPWIDDQTFALGRRDAERRARQRVFDDSGASECTLEEIWAAMPERIWATRPDERSIGDRGIATELAVESELLGAHIAVRRLLDTARRHDVPIVLVSDTYFSIAQLSALLRAAGVDLDGIDIVTSSSRRMGKWAGLLDAVVAEHGGPDGVLHVGDHPIADVMVGHRAGVEVCHVDLPDEDDSIDSSHEAWERLSTVTGSDGARGAALRETLVAAGTLAGDPAYQFGVGVAGPLMAGFAGWASSTAEELGAGALHCLLREGRRIADLIDIVRPDGPPRRLVHASRWGIMRAAVIDGSVDELERSLARRLDMRAEHVTEAFGCDADRVAAVIGGRTIPRDARAEAFRALADDDELRGEIVASAAKLRRNVLTYLDGALHLDDGPLVLCDIGWGGTIQEGITDILRDAGIDNEVIGLYALLSPPGELRAGRGARLLGYLPTVGPVGSSIADARVASRHPEFLERINTPRMGTLLEFADDGTPVTRSDDHDEISDSLQTAQRGVLDFCTTLAGLALHDERRRGEWFADQRFAAASLAALASVIGHPDPRLALSLGTWHHDDVAGTAAEALSGGQFARWVPYANAVDASEITMHDVFWVPGVASAARSALAHQLEALGSGANPDTLCPPSGTGVARIAVFPPDSDLAVAQFEDEPHLGPAGWMLIELRTPSPGARSVRIDFGDTDLIVDIADAEIVLHVGDDGDTTPFVDGAAELRSAGEWVGGRWLGQHQGIAAGGGHLLVDLPPDLAGTVRSVDVTIAARAWPIDPDTRRRLLPPWRIAGDTAVRRLRSRLPTR